MSFGRPTTSGTVSAAASEKEIQRESKNDPTPTTALDEHTLIRRLKSGGGQVPMRTKWTPRMDHETKERLLSSRLSATLVPTSLLSVDGRYARTHNTPFHSVRHIPPASWEKPLLNQDIPIEKLAVVERPDLEVEHNIHQYEMEQRELDTKQRQARQAFLFRESRLAALHRRKSQRISLEVRSSLRPSHVVTSCDAPQFETTHVPAPRQEGWNGAHQLAHELEDHPYQPPQHLTDYAIDAIESKIAIEFDETLRQRSNELSRKQSIYELEERRRLENIQREHLLNAVFETRQHVPQNIDAHLKYLVSARCGPRPPSTRPVSVETYRLVPYGPFKTTKLAHVAWSGAQSVRSGRRYSSGPNSRCASGASTERPQTSRPQFHRHRPISAATLKRTSISRDATRINESGLADLVDSISQVQDAYTMRLMAGPSSSTGVVTSSSTPLDSSRSFVSSSSSPSSSPSSPPHSPRSSSRLGQLPSSRSIEPLSPRLEELSRPLERFVHLRPIDRKHRDFKGLLTREQQREEEKEEYAPQVESSSIVSSSPSSFGVPHLSCLDSRPATARSRFLRQSVTVRTPAPTTVDGPYTSSSSRPTSPNKNTNQRNDDNLTTNAALDHDDAHDDDAAPSLATSHSSFDHPHPPASGRSPFGVHLHRNTARLPMWNRTNRLLKYVGDTPTHETTP